MAQNYGLTEEEVITGSETSEDKYNNCKKSNHDEYVDINDLSLNKLPEKYRNNEMLYLIYLLAALTGCIQIEDETNVCNKILGSGFVQNIRFVNFKDCPCTECTSNGLHKNYAILTVTTVNHVVGTNNNACKARMTIDSPEAKLQIYGHTISKTDRVEDHKEDWCAVEFVSHEIDKVKKLETTLENLNRVQGELYEKYKSEKNVNFVVITGYPHGWKKKVSFGKVLGSKQILKEVRAGQEWCRYQYDAMTCPGSSGSPVFILRQPVCGFGYWFGHPHNHSKGHVVNNSCQRNTSSVGVDKI